jgi:anti-anti-sigma factor
VLSVTGEIDLASLPQLRTEVRRLADDAAPFMIDLTDCDFIDSLGIGVLVGAARRARDAGREFCVVAPTDPVARLLHLSRIDEIIEVRAGGRDDARS